MGAITAPFLAGAALLVLAGVAKLKTPAQAGAALRLAGLPDGSRAVRALAVSELAVGAAALVIRGPGTEALVAAYYAAFALFLVGLLRAGHRRVSCGCFGTRDVGINWLHPVIDAMFAGVAIAAAVTGRSDVPALAGEGLAVVLTTLVQAVLIGFLGVLVFTRGGEVFSHRSFLRGSPARAVQLPVSLHNNERRA